MSSMQEDIQCAGSDTRPPMLDRTDFESWQQRIRLYCLGKDNGENIMKSIKEGPFQMGTVSDVITGGTEGAVQQGPVRARVLNDLSAEEKERYKADIRATNILLQGIPKDIYSLINHYTDAKDIWENVKMILEGSELTKDDRESQLYDEFEHFRQIKGETIQGYYVRFTKLINDMRNIKMTMSRMQLNSKFVNNMLPEWSRFITEVKLNRGLKESNCDQLYAYLKQHEVHANENRIMMERFGQPNNDPLALVSDASVQQYPTQSSKSPQSSTEPYPSDNFQLDSGSSSTENLIESLSNTLALLTQSYRSHLPQTNNQLRASSNARNKAMVQDGKVVVQDVRGRYNATNQGRPFQRNNARGNGVAGNVGGQNRGGMINPGQAKPIKPNRLNDSALLQGQMLLMQALGEESGLDERISRCFCRGTGYQPLDDDYVEDNEEPVVQCNASSVRNDALMSILDEMHEQGVQSRLANKPDMDQSVQTVHMLCKPKSFYDEKNKVAIGYKNPLCLTRAKQAQSALYNVSCVLVTTNHTPTVIHDSEDTREIAEITRNRMLLKMQSPLCVENKEKATGKRPETIITKTNIQHSSKPISTLTVYPPNTPVKLVPRILPTKSQVKINLYVLTQLFTEFDKTCKTRITPSGITEGERGFEQTKRCYLTEVIPFFKTLKEHFVGVQTALFKEVKEMKEIFDQMNNEVDKNTVDKQCAEIEKKNLLIENENLIVNCLSTQLLYDVEKSRCLDLEADMSKVHDESKLISKLEREYLNLQLKYQHLQESFDNKNSQASQEAPDFNSFFKIKNLEHQIQEKDNVIRHLKDLVANVNDRSREPYNAIDVTALIEQNDCDRVELEKVKQHYKELYDSIKITRAHTSEKTSTMLNEIESLKAQLRSKEPCFTSDYVKPKVLAPGMYAIDVKPIPHPLKNNRSAHLNYISHLKESVETVREIVEEARVVKPLDNSLNYACQYTKLSQELLECVIGTCPKSFNERDNKAPSTPVTRKKQVTFSDKPGTSSSNTQKHKVHQRVQQTNIPVLPSTGVNDSTEASGSKPRSNTKKNRILPAKKENKKEVEVRLRTNNHGMCVVNILKSVNATPTVRIVLNKEKQIWKPKGKLSDNSLNKTKQIWKQKGKLSDNSLYKTKRVWKATGKLFADIGYQWRPTGKKLTLGKLDCGSQWRPTGKKFALGEMCHLTKLSVKCCSKHMTGNRSKLMNFVEKFIGSVRFGNDHLGAIMGYGDYVMGDSVISRVYYVEGLGHNLFSVGQFCDSDLEVAFRKHTCFVRDIKGTYILKVRPQQQSVSSRTDNGSEFVQPSEFCLEYYEGVGLISSNVCFQEFLKQNGVVERRNHTLVEAAGTMMIFSKAPMFLWAEAVATALFGALCYPANDSENLGKFQAKADIGIFVGYAPSRKGYRIYNKRTRRLMETIHVTFDEMHQSMAPVHMSSGPAPFIMTPGQLKSGLAPTDKELEMLFQPMFDEHLEQSRVNEPVPSATEFNAQVVPPVQHQEIAEEPIQEDTPIIHDVLPPSHNLVTGDPGSAQSSSGNVNAAEPNQVNYPPDHLRRWTKDHPLDNIVGNPSRPVSTRKQLASDALSMQDEIHEFDRLEVWELVPRPIYVMVIALKWIYKVKLDEYGDVLKNKARWNVKMLFGMRDLQEEVFVMFNLKDLKDQDNHPHVISPDVGSVIGRLSKHQGRGTINMGLWYPKDNAMSLTAYADADHAGCQDSEESSRGKFLSVSFLEIDCYMTFINHSLLSANVPDIYLQRSGKPGIPEPVEMSLQYRKKTSGSDKPRHPVLQMLWGIVTQTNVDHAELIWEEFTQGIRHFSHTKQATKPI
ncbi:retrovirus-related pol polyprotein from transposon TNT 1-94 [Tanacetum coccineum]|uniref:Retrovirus-related pol polyprotein from transposon TNT 1-94 n=1 Tax=Tanacetum coccineum TaxID=301880 RepID=A0ABQ4WR75_9ASTR